VDKKFEFGLTHVTPSQFKKQIDYLIGQGYNLVTLTDLLYRYSDDPLAIAITFDDGYEDIFDYAFPILQEYNIPATIFLISSYIGKFNKWDANLGWIKFKHVNSEEITKLIQAGWEIGSHGVSHRSLKGLTKRELESEIGGSKKYLEEKFNIKVSFFASPFGKINSTILETALNKGYRGVCGFYNFKCYRTTLGIFEIPRLAVYFTDSLNSIDRKLSTGWGLKREIFKQSVTHFFSNATILVNSLK